MSLLLTTSLVSRIPGAIQTVASEDGIDPVSLAALERKMGCAVNYVIVPRGQVVTGLRYWYARHRGQDSRALLHCAVAKGWLTLQQSDELWQQFVPRQLLFAEVLTSLGHINNSAMSALLLRHERSEKPLGEFLVEEGVVTQETLSHVLQLQQELQLSMEDLLKSAGLTDDQVAELQQEQELA